MIEIAEGSALNRQSGEVRRHLLGTGDGSVEQDNTPGSLGLKVLEKQSGHPTGADHRNLFLIEGNEIVNPAGLSNLQLGQLNGCRTDRNGTGPQVGLRTHPLTGADGLVEQAVQDWTNGAMLLAQAVHLFDLGQDLAFPQDQRIQASRDTHQVPDGLLVVVGKEMGHELRELKAGMLTEKTADG